MNRRLTTSVRPRHVPWLAALLLVGCDEQAITPPTVRAPEFSAVVSDDPTRVITVGVDAPANLTVTGTVAGIVVAVDNAVVDLSGATVDCSGQPTPDDPRIGVWIGPGRSHVQVKGRGTGVVKNCGVGVLIGPTVPMSGEPGGFANRVDGLVVHDTNCPSGPWAPQELVCDTNIGLSNSHDNTIVANHTIGTEWGIVLIGADPGAAASGGNEVSRNTVEGNPSFSVFVASNGNTVRGNTIRLGEDPAWRTWGAILVRGDHNVIGGNTLTALEEAVRVDQGADDNTLTRNVVMAGRVGFVAEANSFRNLFSDNSALPTDGPSAIDRSGACVNNTWTKNAFVSADPLCIFPVTLDAVSFTSATDIQLDGAAVTFGSTITNQSAKLTDVALRSWVTQGPYTRRAGGLSLVDCRGALGVLLRDTCVQTGDTLSASNAAGGRGTLAVGGATALVELVRLLDGDTGVVDSRTVPITITRPASGSYWEILAPMPTPRSGLAVAAGNDVLYAVGGYGAGWYTPAVEAYDPTTNSWSTKPPLPTQQRGAAAAVVGGLLYVVGGYTGFAYTGAVEAYDPATNSWSARAPMPTPRAQAGLGVVNGVLYAVGGENANGRPGTLEAYDPATNSWTTKTSMPTPRRAAVAVIDGVLYAVGGYADAGGYYSSVVEAYDPATDSWSARASLPPQTTDVVVGAVNGRLYALGGGASGDVEVYDPLTDTWAASSMMPTPRWGFGVGAINGVLYTVGGTALVIYTYVGAVEAYHP